jgi:glycosyltransferase involved in cell wall biosynthesis
MLIVITSPSLNTDQNVSGISAVTEFIISGNTQQKYRHFELGKKDDDTRNMAWFVALLKTYPRWLRVVLSAKDALIHFNLALEKRSLLRDSPLILATRLCNKRLIIHLHGGALFTKVSGSWWLRWHLKLLVGKRGTVIVLSEAERQLLGRELLERKVFVLPNAIRLDEAMVFRRPYPTDDVLKLLFLGRIAMAKGIDAIFQALECLKRQGKRVKFVMAGKGPEEALYVRKCYELLGSDFEFKGVVTGEQKLALLKTCDVFVLPSLYEGMPIALLESMSFGLVPVVTSVGSVSDVVTDGRNGIILKRQSPQEIATAVVMLIENRQYMHRLSRNARRYIFAKCNAERYFNRLNTIYKDSAISPQCCMDEQ